MKGLFQHSAADMLDDEIDTAFACDSRTSSGQEFGWYPRCVRSQLLANLRFLPLSPC
jgi:hypothetical protein